ncbi:hypothetical protein P8H26_15295 [Pseudochrobactrum sp. sp1633]|uniref:WYL domain-containing protein n=1 Tax=Pseudochrobactrum sp. sp1633 TaxID=3036706 RepID=UPI0025A5152C|nr:WYL domain-containing protein [Pseudochrobactrum sp. sp1633]MDM8346755.1 hypothetical protein [Pseudochrobactrum sp. sp1633]HWD13325.1 WYL domain-containing protein [Pseudochrobactrum sp.]
MLAFPMLCEAIRQRRQVRFIYQSFRWIAEPYLVGYSAHGDMVLNGWVVAHRRESGWQQFHVPLISNVTLSQKRFLRARPDYDPYDKSVAQVIWRFENINQSFELE